MQNEEEIVELDEKDLIEDEELTALARYCVGGSYGLALPGFQRLRSQLAEAHGEFVLVVREIYRPKECVTENAVGIIRPIGAQYSLGIITDDPLIVLPTSFEVRTVTHATLLDAPGVSDKPMTLGENIAFHSRDALLGLLVDFPEMGQAPVIGEFPFDRRSRCAIHVGDTAVHAWAGRTYLTKAVLNTLEESLYDRLSVHPAAA